MQQKCFSYFSQNTVFPHHVSRHIARHFESFYTVHYVWYSGTVMYSLMLMGEVNECLRGMHAVQLCCDILYSSTVYLYLLFGIYKIETDDAQMHF